ncbi:sporulation protein YqfD [Faecalibacterium sp. An192]|uniref:sporulation protein YqfD n=1 Tax=Faecalibacterium sp. An192 TaxID=1965581 RepID=UPI000B398600|nr:sporulation protein YqfD [Faecalibacterium sp. An192]OUP29701.1 hypothetical protein B5F27_02605 [Faecalibacterium sp. An192]
MEVVQLWAGVVFTALSGDTEGLLNDAAQAGIHLSRICPQPGGFSGCCAAWRYQKLAALARRHRVRLQVRRRKGLFFHLRPLFRRKGLWAGLVVFVPLLLWSRGQIWSVDYGSLTAGQQARAALVLREETGLEPGVRVTQDLLTAGEYALLKSGEFSWASLNFFGGRLEVEAAAAKQVPAIFSGKLQTLCARIGGVVTEVNLKSGTALVVPGQQVEAGQPLIGTSRTERDGTPIFAPAAGVVMARFEWSAQYDQSLTEEVPLLTGRTHTKLRLSCGGFHLTLPGLDGGLVGPTSNDVEITRHVQMELGGLPLPIAVEETVRYQRRTRPVNYSDDLALAMARLHCLQELEEEWPGAEIVAQQETVERKAHQLHYAVTYTLLDNIVEG